MGRINNTIKRIIKRFETKPPVYIHIPKTGGTYLGQRETDKEPVIQPIRFIGHYCISSAKDPSLSPYPPQVGFHHKYIISKDEIKNCFVFTTVRNIFEWLVSYAWHAGGWNPKYHDTNHYDYKSAQKGFDYLVKTIADREKDIWPCRKLIHFQMFSDDGDLMVDWINRTETLDSDLHRLAKLKKLRYNSKSRQRVGKNKDYRPYYNDTLIDLVRTTWGRELRLFGYDFDKFEISSSILGISINSKTKRSIKYFWGNDCLTINNKNIL